MKGKNSRPNQTLLVLAGILAAILIAFLLYKQIFALKNARAVLEKEKMTYQKAQTMLQDLKETEKQAEFLEDKLEKYGLMLPEKPDENVLISGLDICADESGVYLQQIHFGSRLAKDGYTEMPLVLVLEGRYNDILTFLKAIQKEGQRAIRIDRIKMSKGQEEQTLVRADIGARAFFIVKK